MHESGKVLRTFSVLSAFVRSATALPLFGSRSRTLSLMSVDSREETTSSKPWAGNQYLSKTLYAFDLPTALHASLQLRSIDVTEEKDVEATSQTFPEQKDVNGKAPNRASACKTCPSTPHFSQPLQARAHLRSDWHRYNLALVARGQQEQVLDEEAFNKLADELSSDESDPEDSNEADLPREKSVKDPVSTLLTRMRRMSLSQDSDATEDEDSTNSPVQAARSSHIWFVTKAGGQSIPQTQLGVLRFLFPEPDGDVVPKEWHISMLMRMQCGKLAKETMRSATKLKGASAANEAASMLGATFMDSSGEIGSIGEEDSDDEELKDTQTSSQSSHDSLLSKNTAPVTPIRTWTIVLFGGGDFAAITIALNPFDKIVSERKGTSERQFLVIARKQFHRYTTRRKQGGSQAGQDASGRFAKSAGAQLRRYGEQALGEEIRQLLDTPTWRAAIGGSERVWVRAGLRSARNVLWSWNTGESPLEDMRRQDKIFNLPIATRKPTVGECLRCFAEMTRIRIRHDTEEELRSRDELYRAQLRGAVEARQRQQEKRKERQQRQLESKWRDEKARSERASTTKLDPREQLLRERLVRLIDMIRKGRVGNVVTHLEKYEASLFGDGQQEPDDVDDAMEAAQKRINGHLPGWWRSLDAKQKGVQKITEPFSESLLAMLTTRQHLVPLTLLQVAAESGSEQMVSYFLVERRSDPTISIPPPPSVEDDKGTHAPLASSFPHRTAYDLCSSRDARDVFRRLMADQPTWYPWSEMESGGARVPKALTEEMHLTRKKEEETRDRRQLIKERARQRVEEQQKQEAHHITDADRQQASKPPSAQTESAHPSRNRLGGSNTAPRALQQQQSAGLTPEMRARIEREKRARAAEARMKNLQSS